MTIHKTRNDRFVRETELYLYNFLPLIQAMSNCPELVLNIRCVTRNVLWHIDSSLANVSMGNDTQRSISMYIYLCSRVVDALRAGCWEWAQDSLTLDNLSVLVLFTLKDPVPIDLHYMTDRLQWFELEVLVCVLLKKQSPTSRMPCRGYADKHHIYIFGWTIPSITDSNGKGFQFSPWKTA